MKLLFIGKIIYKCIIRITNISNIINEKMKYINYTYNSVSCFITNIITFSPYKLIDTIKNYPLTLFNSKINVITSIFNCFDTNKIFSSICIQKNVQNDLNANLNTDLNIDLNLKQKICINQQQKKKRKVKKYQTYTSDTTNINNNCDCDCDWGWFVAIDEVNTYK